MLRAPHGRKADVGQHGFRNRIAVQHVAFSAALVVEGDLQREPRLAGPLRIGQAAAVSDHVTRICRYSFAARFCFHGRLPFGLAADLSLQVRCALRDCIRVNNFSLCICARRC
jgi:hypothetical protein